MTFSRDQLTARHAFATAPVSLPPPADISAALAFEKAGNWYSAGEAYSDLDRTVAIHVNAETRARLLAKAGTCFEIAGQPRPAARVYADAARLLSPDNLSAQTAGELFNRSARQHFLANEFFFAGSNWRAAASEFKKIGNQVVTPADSILPVPVSAAGNTIAAMCLNAAGDAFLRVPSEEVWACGTYWEAGDAFSQTFPSPNIQTYNSYRNALMAAARFYHTLEPEALRRSLPLTSEGRAAKINPLKILEDAAFRCNHHHQSSSEPHRSANARRETDRQLAAAFRDFSLQFTSTANSQEARFFRIAERDRIRRIALAERRYAKWLLYSFWKLTSGYGESLGRWAAACGFAADRIRFVVLFAGSNQTGNTLV